MRVWFGDGVRCAGREQGVLHAQLHEQTILKDFCQRCAVKFFGDEAEQDLVGVARVVLLARSEERRMLERDAEQILRCPNPGRIIVEVFREFRRCGVVVQAAPHLEQLTDRDVVAIVPTKVSRHPPLWGVTLTSWACSLRYYGMLSEWWLAPHTPASQARLSLTQASP
jgi:hypothetical protein